jgi:hypothetical protein
MKYWKIIADDLHKAGWSLGGVSAIDAQWRTKESVFTFPHAREAGLTSLGFHLIPERSRPYITCAYRTGCRCLSSYSGRPCVMILGRRGLYSLSRRDFQFTVSKPLFCMWFPTSSMAVN